VVNTNINQVPWAFLAKEEFELKKTELLPLIKEHFTNLIQKKGRERAEEYLKYLTGHCGFWLEWGMFFGAVDAD